MIELRNDTLRFRFPDVHDDAGMDIDFQRTLRLPDDGKHYPLPVGVGRFPLRHVDDFPDRLPSAWLQHGGVMLPMYQAEALWISFTAEYPCAVKVAAGRINTVTGRHWVDRLCASPQDYLVAPEQPCLDGFMVARGAVRQFVAMPLGLGCTAEEQLTGSAEHGGLQIAVCPMRADRYEALRAGHYPAFTAARPDEYCAESTPPPDMGLAPGGRLHQPICEDVHGLDAWQQTARSRCFVHIANSDSWLRVTGEPVPMSPPCAADYAAAGLPWFRWYDDKQDVLDATPELAGLRGVGESYRLAIGRSPAGDATYQPGGVHSIGSRRRVREPHEGESRRSPGA